MHRWIVERDNRRVEIALDYSELRAVAAADNHVDAAGKPRSFAEILSEFYTAGATSVAVEEDTIGGLEQSRRLTILPGADRGVTVLRPLNAASSQRILTALRNKTHFVVEATPTGDILVHQPITNVRAVGIGLDPTATKAVRQSGMRVVGRVSNYPGADAAGIQWTLKDLEDARASTVIFTGEEVLGYIGPLPPDEKDPNPKFVADTLRADDLNYGTVEFGKQKGDVELQRAAPDRTVRVHTILGTEMATADIPSNIQRFLLATRERNIRVLFVRLFESEPDPVDANARYIEKIRQGLDETRLVTLKRGTALGYGELHASRVIRGLIGLGVAAAYLLLFDSITRVFAGGLGNAAYVCALLPALALAGLSLTTGSIGPKIVALAAGCIYPSLALLHRDMLRSENGVNPSSVAFARFGSVCAITFLGIAAIVGLLADRLFLIKTDMFMGVKLVAIAPALVAALVYGLSLRASEKRPWPVAVREAGAMLRRVGTEPINLIQVVVGLAVVSVVVVIVMRSGNDPGVGVSAFELKIRSLLDHLMPARPVQGSPRASGAADWVPVGRARIPRLGAALPARRRRRVGVNAGCLLPPAHPASGQPDP